jgi:hypothetical protein
MGGDHGFAEVWSSAHHERSAYLVSWFSSLWAAFKEGRRSRVLAAEGRSKAFSAGHGELAKAA